MNCAPQVGLRADHARSRRAMVSRTMLPSRHGYWRSDKLGTATCKHGGMPISFSDEGKKISTGPTATESPQSLATGCHLSREKKV